MKRTQAIELPEEEIAKQKEWMAAFAALEDRPHTYCVVTYGCQMNAHDSEKLEGLSLIHIYSFLLPLIFLCCIGVSILWNMGSNYLMGEISYITKAVAAVLQLAVTLDYSIFLWHSYKEQKTLCSDRCV